MTCGDKIGVGSRRISHYETAKIIPFLDATVRIARAIDALVAKSRLRTVADGII
jgi:hypothetical protein